MSSPERTAARPHTASPAAPHAVHHRLFVFAGGGTGGHLAPGIAVADELRRREPDCRIRFVGSGRRIEARMIDPAGYELARHDAPPLTQARRHPLRFVTAHWRAVRDAQRRFQQDRPAAVIGLGGFASVPVVLAAQREHVPVLLLEQNVIPGRATWWLARRHPVCVTFEETRDFLARKTVCYVTGNPLRPEIAALARAFPDVRQSAGHSELSEDLELPEGLDPRVEGLHPRQQSDDSQAGPGASASAARVLRGTGTPEGTAAQPGSAVLPGPAARPGDMPQRPVLLILGGSLGSRQVNESVLQAARTLRKELSTWRIIHQTGPDGCEEVRCAYRECSLEAIVAPFFDSLSGIYAQATLAVSRSGASTLTELAAAGVPAVLMAWPLAAGDHQTRNAEVFAAAGAAVRIENPTQTSAPLNLTDSLRQLLASPGRLAAMRTAARKLARPNAAQDVADRLQSLIR